eukprot:6449094-Amphidinium_carterae.1
MMRLGELQKKVPRQSKLPWQVSSKRTTFMLPPFTPGGAFTPVQYSISGSNGKKTVKDESINRVDTLSQPSPMMRIEGHALPQHRRVKHSLQRISIDFGHITPSLATLPTFPPHEG